MDSQDEAFRQIPNVGSSLYLKNTATSRPTPFKASPKETLFQMDLQEATSRQTPGVPSPGPTLFKGKPGLQETLFQMDLQEATSRQTPGVPSPGQGAELNNLKKVLEDQKKKMESLNKQVQDKQKTVTELETKLKVFNLFPIRRFYCIAGKVQIRIRDPLSFDWLDWNSAPDLGSVSILLWKRVCFFAAYIICNLRFFRGRVTGRQRMFFENSARTNLCVQEDTVRTTIQQGTVWGSVTFWCGSGYGSNSGSDSFRQRL
jgi:hypothetical protein